MIFKLTVVLVLSLSLSCTPKPHQDAKDAPDSVIRVRDQAGDFRVPAKLWDLMLPSDKVASQYKSENDEEMMGSSVLFANLTVVLEEKTPGVLVMPKIRIEFPKGGGHIDLARWVSGKAGSYFVRFETEGLSDPLNVPHIFFLSKAKKRRVDDRIVGSGCKSYYDITHFIVGKKASKGVIVNTTRNFDSSTLGGHFLFSWQRDGVYYVTQAKFSDSAHPQLYCNSQDNEKES